MGGRLPDSSVEVASPQITALRSREYQPIRTRLRKLAQVLIERRSGEGGKRQSAATGLSLGWTRNEAAIDLTDLLGHGHPAVQQVNAPDPQADQLSPPQPTERGHQHQRAIAGRHSVGQRRYLRYGGKAHLRRLFLASALTMQGLRIR
jgi:hypothetical protein